THYRSTRSINIGPLREQYEALLKMSVEEATADSPFLGDRAKQRRYPLYYSRGSGVQEERALIEALVNSLADKDYWPGKLPGVSHENPGFSDAPLPQECISTWTYMQNMTHLINWLTVR
ncbi:MAG: pectate lyase, partial [Bacteroidales bacterium]|nr:pectate lyase [Bacteroidales bacterium]